MYARDDYDVYARGDYDYDLYARGDDGLYLEARDLDDAVTLLARDLLYARLDEPKREHYASREKYEAAWKSWNRHSGDVMRAQQSAYKDHPQAGEPAPKNPADWKKWSQANSQATGRISSAIKHASHEHHKDLKKIQGKR